LIFDHNFSNFRPIFKMVSLLEAQGNSKHIFESLHLTLYMFLYYIVKHENFRCANFSRIVMCETSEFILPDM